MAQNDEVKLLGLWVSPFSRRVEWALKLKGIDYEYIEEDIFDKSPRLLELNPITKKVPVLVHNGKVVIESFLIIEYIDEVWSETPLLPEEPYRRSVARFWAKFGDELMQPVFQLLFPIGEEEKEKKVKKIMEDLEKLERELNGQKWFGGDTIGYLDLALGWLAYWLPVWEEMGSTRLVDPIKFPSIAAWSSNFLDHPVINGCDSLPDRDKMFVYFHDRVKGIVSGLNTL